MVGMTAPQMVAETHLDTDCEFAFLDLGQSLQPLAMDVLLLIPSKPSQVDQDSSTRRNVATLPFSST